MSGRKLSGDWTCTATGSVTEHVSGPLLRVLRAGLVWRSLTGPQRELLLSAAVGFPVKSRGDVRDRMIARGLVTENLGVTEAGALVVQWRPL